MLENLRKYSAYLIDTFLLPSITAETRDHCSLFVFLMVGPKQNAGSHLTPISDTIFDALSHGTLGFDLHGSFLNHFLIGGNSSTANQIL